MSATKFKQIIMFIISILIYLSGNNVIADSLILDNGDILTGKLVSLSGKVVTFNTDYAGTLYVNQNKVDRLKTEAVFTIIYDDGSRETKALNHAINVQKLDVIRSSESSPLTINSSWKRQLTISLAGTSGNNESQNFSMYGESSLLRSKSEQVLNVAQTRESTDALTTTDLLDVKYDFRWLRANRWYNTTSVDYSYDPLKDVSWRSVLGFGGGKKFIDHSLTDLSVDVAVSAVYQSLDDIEEVLPALRIASVFHKKLFGGRLEFLQQNRLLWISEENGGVIDGLFGLRVILSNSLNLDCRSTIKYETNPAENDENVDLTYSIGIGVSF